MHSGKRSKNGKNAILAMATTGASVTRLGAEGLSLRKLADVQHQQTNPDSSPCMLGPEI